ncbi:MAG: ATP-binding cassette domain-containing protein, partial [Pseudomonadota bacterium]|nr:ATP-binding cassette domain-containing protein [Pseudomonadota bacterium]
MIILEDIALRRGQRLLFTGASATLQPGQNIALIGGNGCGKSSLFALLLEELQADAGDIRGLKGLRISHMAQETETSDLTARDYVIAGDAALFQTLQDLARADVSGDYEQSATLHQRMEELDGYSAERRAEQLLLGLGFKREKMNAPMSAFSGGWRIRLNLARALMAPSDLMLLDEPTNHLDLDTTLWLQTWLQSYRGTLLMISHDRDFIDATCERTLEIARRALTAYRGGYTDYERQRAEQMAQQQAEFEQQRRRIADIEEFVRRFRAKATKARQAQSRLKELERMHKVAQAHIDSPFSFNFPPPGKVSDPLLTLSDAALGHGEHRVLSKVS